MPWLSNWVFTLYLSVLDWRWILRLLCTLNIKWKHFFIYIWFVLNFKRMTPYSLYYWYSLNRESLINTIYCFYRLKWWSFLFCLKTINTYILLSHCIICFQELIELKNIRRLFTLLGLDKLFSLFNYFIIDRITIHLEFFYGPTRSFYLWLMGLKSINIKF